MFYLVKRRICRAVASHDTVECKVSGIGLISEVAAVQPFVYAVFSPLDALVGKVPDKAARQTVILFEHIPVFAEVTQTVAHTVCILALDKRFVLVHLGRILRAENSPKRRTVHKFLVLRNAFGIFHLDVHTADYVAYVCRLVGVIMYKSGIVNFEYGFFHFNEVFAVTCLVTQRPAYDTSVVFESFDHILHSVYATRRPLGVALGDKARKSVSFEVGLRHNQNTQLVAQVVEYVLIGVMAVADSGNIIGFAKQQIFEYEFFGYGVTVFGMELVSVDAANLDRHTVECDERASAVFHRYNLYFTETEM